MKTIKDYVQANEDYNCEFMSNHSPDAIEQGIIELLEANEISVSADKNKYKMNFEFES